MSGESLVKGLPVAFEGGSGLDVTRRAKCLHDPCNRDIFGVQLSATVTEVVHLRSGIGDLVGLLAVR